MRRNLLPDSAWWARLLPRARQDTPSTPISARRSRRSVAKRAIVAFAAVMALGLPIVAATPDAARAAESTDGLIHFTFAPGASEARYVMRLRTLGQPPKQAVCRTRDVSGELVLTTESTVVPELSRMTVDQRSLKCEAPLRNEMAQQIMQTAQHPTSTFIAQSAPGLPVPLTPGTQSYQMIGDQIVRGVTKSVTYDTTGTSTMESFEGTSRTVLKMSDFGITPPSLGPLLSVDDEMIAEVDMKASISAPPMPDAEAAP
jgi:polyisoprenoid-binding protein YceI